MWPIYTRTLSYLQLVFAFLLKIHLSSLDLSLPLLYSGLFLNGLTPSTSTCCPLPPDVGEYYWVRLIGSDAVANGEQTEVNAVEENTFFQYL